MLSSDFELLARCNHTELLQICRRIGLDIPADTVDDTLIKYILGEAEPPPSWGNVIDSWRLAIMAFLLDHWEVVRAQLSCPARSGDPRSCFNCIDTQVISCLVQNSDNESLIQLKRKP